MSQEDLPRFFALPINPPAVELPAAEAHHALNVLRLRAGMEVEVFDGQGAHAVGRISHARHGQVTVTVLRVDPPTCRPEPVVHLAFAVPKGKRLDWLLEKATELGAASLQPVVFQRSVAGGEELSEGKRLFENQGCRGCHKLNGVGGTIGPDLSLEGANHRAPEWLESTS